MDEKDQNRVMLAQIDGRGLRTRILNGLADAEKRAKAALQNDNPGPEIKNQLWRAGAESVLLRFSELMMVDPPAGKTEADRLERIREDVLPMALEYLATVYPNEVRLTDCNEESAEFLARVMNDAFNPAKAN